MEKKREKKRGKEAGEGEFGGVFSNSETVECGFEWWDFCGSFLRESRLKIKQRGPRIGKRSLDSRLLLFQ